MLGGMCASSSHANLAHSIEAVLHHKKEELLKAKATPQNYKNLKVRVSGFSGYFTSLREELQDNVIERTIHK